MTQQGSPPVITVAGLKGGVGKTTTAIALASLLGRNDARSLLVDADPQASALTWSAQAGDALACAVVALPVADLPRRIPALAHGYGSVVVDTPPGDAKITRAAILAADLVLLPMAPSLLEVDRLAPVIGLLAEVEPPEGEGSRPYAVVLTRVRAGTRSARDVRSALAELDIPVLDAEVPLRESVALAFGGAAPETAYADVLAELFALANFTQPRGL